MENIVNKIKLNPNKIESLEEAFKTAYQDESFKELVHTLNRPKKELMQYTSRLEECAKNYQNCKNCKSLLACKNMITGYAFLPRVVDDTLEFEYRACRYKKNLDQEKKHLQNITYLKGTEKLKEAKMKNIHMEDRNRYETIRKLKEFMEQYLEKVNPKGLYLYGNFGCGKSYLVAAMFSELAKKGVKSTIVFWPEFLRELKSSFGSDYEEKYRSVKKTPLLLIDDIGAEATTEWGRDEILCPLLQYRMDEELPTFFTSNLDMNLLEEHLSCSKKGIDVVKARRIMERIKQLTIPVEMLSKNKREETWGH